MSENVRDRDELLLNAIVTGDTSGIEPRDRDETFIKAIAEKKTDMFSLINNSDYPLIRIYTTNYEVNLDSVEKIEYEDGETTVEWYFDDIVSHWDTLKNSHFIVGYGTNSGTVAGALPVIIAGDSDFIDWYLIDNSSLAIRSIRLQKNTSKILYIAI